MVDAESMELGNISVKQKIASWNILSIPKPRKGLQKYFLRVYSPGMNWRTVAANLRHARKAAGPHATTVSRTRRDRTGPDRTHGKRCELHPASEMMKD